MLFRCFRAPRSFLLIVAASTAASAAAQAASLEVTISGIAKPGGAAVIRAYQGEEGWLDDGSEVAKEVIRLDDWSTEQAVVARLELEPGQYAVSVYHDEDDDGELDSNFIGIPKEPAGLSNKPKARMGPPKYEDAAFDLPAEGMGIEVELN